MENLDRTPIHVATLQEVVAPPAEGASADAAKTGQQGAPPAAATAPQTSNASATPAPAAGATAAAGDAAKEEYNQVSHVALYRFVSKNEFDPATFELINSRVADSFLGGSGGGSAGSMMMGAMPGGGQGQGVSARIRGDLDEAEVRVVRGLPPDFCRDRPQLLDLFTIGANLRRTGNGNVFLPAGVGKCEAYLGVLLDFIVFVCARVGKEIDGIFSAPDERAHRARMQPCAVPV